MIVPLISNRSANSHSPTASSATWQLILEEIERLTGPAELVPVESRAQGAYQLIPNDWGRTYLQYHRGIDMPGSFLTGGF